MTAVVKLPNAGTGFLGVQLSCGWMNIQYSDTSHARKALLIVCTKKKKRARKQGYDFRMRRPIPDPPTLEEFLAPPPKDTEKILEAASQRSRPQEIKNIVNDDLGPRFKPKEGALPWALYLDFDTPEDVLAFVDELDIEEVKKQRRKYGVAFYPDEVKQRRAFKRFLVDQFRLNEEFHEMMKKRIVKANIRAEWRHINRERRALARARSGELADSDIDTDFDQEYNSELDEEYDPDLDQDNNPHLDQGYDTHLDPYVEGDVERRWGSDVGDSDVALDAPVWME